MDDGRDRLGVPCPAVQDRARPADINTQALNVEYYSQSLQGLIEAAVELCLGEGLECPVGLRTEFDIENLLRMDSLRR